MQGRSDKKITITTKTNNKKPPLQIKVPHEPEHSGIKSGPAGFGSFAKEEHVSSKYQSISTVTSPTHLKTVQPMSQIPEQDKGNKKKPDFGSPINKKTSAKEPPSPKIELQHRMSANTMGSPKAETGKGKVLISYGSEKNFNAIKPMEKKDTPQGRGSKMEELERLLQDQKSRTSLLMNRQGELVSQVEALRKQNGQLKVENTELRKKLEKFKASNEETKKMLKERISSFNEQGGELQALRKHSETLEQRVAILMTENQSLKAEINKFECQNLSLIRDGRGPIATSIVKQVVPLSGSRISGLYLRNSEDGDLKIFDGIDEMQQDLDLQSYITENQQSYLEEYKANVDVFDKIRIEYEQILASIELRYKNLSEDYEQTIATQAGQLYDLEMKNDELRENKVENGSNVKLSLELDEVILRDQEEIARLNLSLFDLKVSNKELLEEVEHKRAQCKFLQAELDIAAMKKKFKDENDKFEFNVVKLNLLNIIDKLKLQIDREKEKYKSFRNRVSSEN